VALVLCTLALAPAAWGRDNRFRMGHPIGDEGFLVASARQGTVISIAFIEPIPGCRLPFLVITQSSHSRANALNPPARTVQSPKGARR